jgi:hypothetical protein
MSKQTKSVWILAALALLLAQLACTTLSMADCAARGGTWYSERDDDGQLFYWCEVPPTREASASMNDEVLTSAESMSPVCQEKNLSAEECAALGIHSFEIISCIVSNFGDNTCRCGETLGVLEFSGEEAILQFGERSSQHYARQASNLYKHTFPWGEDNLSVSSLTFTAAGYYMKTEIFSRESNALKCILDKKAIFKD